MTNQCIQCKTNYILPEKGGDHSYCPPCAKHYNSKIKGARQKQMPDMKYLRDNSVSFKEYNKFHCETERTEKQWAEIKSEVFVSWLRSLTREESANLEHIDVPLKHINLTQKFMQVVQEAMDAIDRTMHPQEKAIRKGHFDRMKAKLNDEMNVLGRIHLGKRVQRV